jgi:hypothetical protein
VLLLSKSDTNRRALTRIWGFRTVVPSEAGYSSRVDDGPTCWRAQRANFGTQLTAAACAAVEGAGSGNRIIRNERRRPTMVASRGTNKGNLKGFRSCFLVDAQYLCSNIRRLPGELFLQPRVAHHLGVVL